MPSINQKKILFTIDVEDWFQVENLRPWFPPSGWDKCPLRVAQNTHRILDLFDRFSPKKIKATFFVLGWVAEKVPELVREINRRGHEVASHGFGHKMCNQLDNAALERDLRRSRNLLEQTIGTEVAGYRAPNFSISDQVLKAIQSAGYHYDSSYNSFSGHGRYGHINVKGAETNGIAINLAGAFKELPVSNLKLGRRVIPWGGGGYFRFFPFAVFKAGVQRILRRNDAYLFYLHPWEIDPDQPRVGGVNRFSAWRHYVNLDKTDERLVRLIKGFKDCDFITCSQYLKELPQ